MKIVESIAHSLARPLAIAAALAGAGLVSACQTTQGAYTSDNPLSRTTAIALVRDYMSENTPLVFVVSKDGKRYGYRYCSVAHCRDTTATKFKALESCRERSGGECYVFASRKTIVATKANGTAYTLDDIYNMTGNAATVELLSSTKICEKALGTDNQSWSTAASDAAYVREAQKRGMDESDCSTRLN